MRAAVPVAAALLLLLAVLWVRGGTGSDVPPDASAAPPATATPGPPPDPPSLRELGRAALWPVRLGTPVASLPDGLRAGAAGTAGCRPLLREPGASGGAVGWVVDGRVVSVAAHRRGDTGEAVPLAAWVASEELADVDAVLTAPEAQRRPEVVDRPDLRLLVDVTTVVGGLEDDGLALVGSDLGGRGGTAWLELREDAAARCAPDGDVARVLPDARGVPPADDGGWQDVRIGDPLPTRVATTRAAQEERGACTVLPAADPDDPLSVVLLAEGVVRGVGLRAGGLDGVVAVGDPPERLRSALPDRVGAAELRAMRDNGGVAVGLGGGVRLVVGVARPSAVVPGVDVPVPGPDLLVASVLVAQPCS